MKEKMDIIKKIYTILDIFLKICIIMGNQMKEGEKLCIMKMEEVISLEI